MRQTVNPGMSRRKFLRGVGAGAGAFGLSSMAMGLAGCGTDSSSPSPLLGGQEMVPVEPDDNTASRVDYLLNGQEMVGGVSARNAMIALVAGVECQPSTRFRVSYDTVSGLKASEHRHQTRELSGFELHDAVSFPLDSLAPDTRYFYRTAYNHGDGWYYRNERSFQTQRSPGQSFRFCIATDTHVYPDENRLEGRRKVFQNIAGDNPDFLVTLGDDAFVSYQSHKVYPWPQQEKILGTMGKMRGLLDEACHSMFYLPVNGNHEGLYGWCTDREEYHQILDARTRYFPVPDSRTFPEGGDPLGRYGAFTWGDVLFIWLDPVGFCDVDPYIEKDNNLYILGPQQRAFLEKTLADNASVPWKFILSHEVFGGLEGECSKHYSRGNANVANKYEQAVIQDLMVRYDVQAFFYGHDHVFSVSEAQGRSYICAGHAGSGCPWTDILQECYEPSVLFSRSPNGQVPAGHVRVDVTPSEVTVSYVIASGFSNNGSVIDSYTMRL